MKCKTDSLSVPSHPVHKILRMSAYIGLDPTGKHIGELVSGENKTKGNNAQIQKNIH